MDRDVPRWRRALAVAVQVGFLIAAFTMVYDVWSRRQPPEPPPSPLLEGPLALNGAVMRGRDGSTVALIEYADPECPYCGRFARDTLPTLVEDYVETGKVTLAFFHLPLPRHPNAAKASEALECANEQGRFWPLHDRLFADQTRLAESDLIEHAKALELDVAGFEACLGGKKTEKIKSDVAAALELGISSTPTFLIGLFETDGRVAVKSILKGAQPLQAFATAIAAADSRRATAGPSLWCTVAPFFCRS